MSYLRHLRAHRPAIPALLALSLAVAGCADNDQLAPLSPTPVTVVRSTVTVPSVAAPPNPLTLSEGPADAQQARALVYEAAEVPPAEVRHVPLCMPGFLGGANSFHYLGRRIVERSGGTAVVWAVDRRANALEDQTGFDEAERTGDPDLAKAYYFEGAEVNGRRFDGFLTQNGADISYLSEWGLAVHIADLDALVTEAQSRYPSAAIFLLGHSLGATIAPIYAAWSFEGYAGFERLAGLVLLEGTPRPDAAGNPPTQQEYETTGVAGGLGSSSVAQLRSGNPVSSLPFVGVDIFAAAEIVAMRASGRFGDPEELSPDEDIFEAFFRLIFGKNEVPPLTNEAALGFGFDDQFQVLSFVRAAVGETDGPVEPNTSLAAALTGAMTLAPSDPNFTYHWITRDEQEEPEPTLLATLAEALYAGPSNLIEWYFPARITLDVAAVSDLDVSPSGDWRADVYGLRVTENERVDLPVFAAGGERGLVTDVAAFDAYRQSIAPVLRDGTPRADSPDGFRARILPKMAHLDVLTADDSGPGNGLFGPLLDWMESVAPDGRT